MRPESAQREAAPVFQSGKMAYKSAFKDYDAQTMARSVVQAASVSTKHCIEICNNIRGRKLAAAKRILGDAIALRKPLAFRKFNDNIGHKKGIGPGRFAVKACTEVLKALEGCEANAGHRGLYTESLFIRHINANLASRPWHYGRARRRQMKRTHIEIVLEETEKPAAKKAGQDKPKKPAAEKDISVKRASKPAEIAGKKTPAKQTTEQPAAQKDAKQSKDEKAKGTPAKQGRKPGAREGKGQTDAGGRKMPAANKTESSA